MKRFLTILVFSALAFIGFAANASAESVKFEPFTFEIPENWSQDSKNLNEHRIAVLIDPNTENRVEIYRRTVTRDAHADILFNAFNDQLINNSEITEVDKAKERKIDLKNGDVLKGNYAEYTYESSDIPITIVTFSFVKHETAVIIVGYFVRANRADGFDAFDAMLKNIVDLKYK